MKKLINHKEIKDLVAVSYNFLLPSKLEIQCKKGMYFSFDLGWYSTVLQITVGHRQLLIV